MHVRNHFKAAGKMSVELARWKDGMQLTQFQVLLRTQHELCNTGMKCLGEGKELAAVGVLSDEKAKYFDQMGVKRCFLD